MAILNTSGTAVVEYTYDAWGNIHDVSGSLADTIGEANPLTYRGYVYDSEIGMFYLQSRYYDPEVGRFINADGLVATGQGLLGNNMFAYCNNSPQNFSDPSGFSIGWTNRYVDLGGYSGGGFYVPPTQVNEGIALFAEFCETVLAITVATIISKPSQTEEDLYSVYFLRRIGDTSNEIVYVGRVKTSNIGSRMSYHRQRGRELCFCIDGLDYDECRFIEQAGMIWCHTILNNPINNLIRGIGPTNVKRYDYIKAGQRLAENGYWLEEFFPISYWANQAENMLFNGSP